MADSPRPDLDPALAAPEISCRVVRPFLLAIARDHGRELAEAVVARSGLPWDYVDDDHNWVSALWTDRFFEAWAALRYDVHTWPEADHEAYQLWYTVGRESWTRESMGAMYSVVRAMGAPGAVYARVPDLAARGNRLVTVVPSVPGPGRARLVVASRDPDHWNLPPTLVWNLRGLLEGIPLVWGLPPARVSVREVEEADEVTFHFDVQYTDRRLSEPLKLGLGVLLLGSLGALVGGALGGAVGAALGAACGGLAVVAAIGWQRTRELQEALADDMVQMDEVLGRHDARYAELHREGRALRRALLASRKLSGYLAADLVERIVQEPELALELGGQRTHAAVLFADIVGFTPRCEPMAPEEVVDELNLYFSYVDPAFEAHGGVIDKRMGDGIMAVFVPREGEGPDSVHARAVGAGLDMLRALEPCNEALAQRGAAPFRIRVGVAAGPLVQGNMGSEVKLEYTVVGDTVNLAARLEGEATPGCLLVSDEALPEPGEETGAYTVRSRRTIHVKGKAQAVDVVELAPVG